MSIFAAKNTAMGKKINHIGSTIPFLLLGCLILSLIVFSILVEKRILTNETSYTSTPTLILWGALAITAAIYIVKKKLWRRAAVLSIHLAFLFILAGALVTHLFGFSGQLHLRQGESKDQLLSDDGESSVIRLPFTVRLEQFQIITYPGTEAPADFQSTITISDSKGEEQVTISMNHIAQKEGYRLFQHSFDPDKAGSTLIVNYDKWGVIISYIGYFLLLFGMLATLFDPNSKFRKAFKSNFWKGITSIALLATFSPDMEAKPLTLSSDEAKAFGEILVQYQERITTIETLATDFTKKLTGKDSFKEYNATQVFAGWLFSREMWQFEPMIKVKGEEQKTLIGIKDNLAQFTDFFEADGTYKLRSAYLTMGQNDLHAPSLKPLKQLDEKVELIHLLQSGELLKIFPCEIDGEVRLFSPRNYPKQNFSGADSLLVNNFLPLLYESFAQEEDCSEWIRKFIQFQKRQLGSNTPSKLVLGSEHYYLKVNKLPILAYITLTFGLLALALTILLNVKSTGKAKSAFLIALWGSFAYLTLLIVLRSIISNRLPFSNGHETLLSIAWMSQLLSLCLSRKIKIAATMGLLASGFALLTATLSDKDPQITPLMPVLNSPLLSIHVSLMMISYTLLLFVTLSSLIGLITFVFRKGNTKLEEQRTLNTIILYPALFFLTAGIFTGAIWANISWGCYWSWDPKETWALVSLLIYSFIFHTSSLPIFNRPLFYHLYILCAFLFILITYFGVNIFFGGMHSYGG